MLTWVIRDRMPTIIFALNGEQKEHWHLSLQQTRSTIVEDEALVTGSTELGLIIQFIRI